MAFLSAFTSIGLTSAHLHLRCTIVIDVLAGSPSLLTAVALMVCVPLVIFLLCQVAEQEVVLVHVIRVELSPPRVINATPLWSLAEAVMLTAPLL